MKSQPSIDVIIPALNEGRNLAACLDAVFRQEYPRERFRVTVVDGGSKDDTREIARGYGCRVLDNPEVLAEPGVHIGIENSRSDLCCILAVDNLIANRKNFFLKMTRPFVERGVAGAFPLVDYREDEPAVNKYISFRAEPFSEFIYGDACNSRTFGRVYPTIFSGADYEIYGFSSEGFPLLALAQGFIIDRARFRRQEDARHDDILPILDMIRAGGEIAYVPSARIYHHQIMSLRSFARKFRWRIANNLRSERTGGTRRRKGYRRRQFLWLAYSATLILPLLFSGYRMLTTKKWFYAYHFITNTIILLLIPYTYILFVLGKTKTTYRA